MLTASDPLALRSAVQTRAEAFRAAEPKPAPGPEPSRSLRLVPLAELLAEPRAPEWLVRDYLEAGGLACLFGASGTMKSFVALDMGLSVASGLPWQGMDTPNPGSVVYVAGEGFRGLAKRVLAWLLAHDLTPGAVPFYVTNAAVQLLDPGSVGEAMTAIDGLLGQDGAPRLIVLDTLARTFGPGDENSTGDMSRFVAALDALKDRFGCAVLVVHHTGLAEKDRARGASALRAALDWEYRLEGRDGIRVLTCTKTKDFDAPPDLAFEPDPRDTGWTDPETGDPILSVVLRRVDVPGRKAKPLTGAKRVALEALRECCGDDGRAHVNEWRAEAYRRGVSASDDQDSKGRTFRRAVADLLDQGLISTLDDHYWLTGQPDNNRTCPDLSGGHQTGRTGHPPLRGVRLSGVCPQVGDGEAA